MSTCSIEIIEPIDEKLILISDKNDTGSPKFVNDENVVSSTKKELVIGNFPQTTRKFSVIPKPTPVEDIKQSFKGTVLSVAENDFQVRIKDLTNTENPDEIVLISKDEISTHDILMLREGTMFFWHIGYRQCIGQPKERFSVIRFRRLSRWTSKEIKIAAEKAREYVDFFELN